jgi:L-ascorbate metabolism protein UlaG (beta-lactamase superfamily)
MAKEIYKIIYTSCMGTLINYNNKNILIDSIISPNILPYPTVDKDILMNIVKKKPPFSSIDLILITHEHKEHFQPDLVCQILSACSEATLIAPKAVIADMRKSKYFKKRFITQLISIDLDHNKSIDLSIKNIRLIITRLMHDDQNKYKYIQNITFLLYLGEHRILHVGDSLPDVAIFRESELINKDITCLIVPFIFLITESGVEAISSINPRYLLATHFPMREHDVNKRFENAQEIKDNPLSPFPKNTYLLSESMTEILLK